MAKEWILNQANMRWGLTKKTKVGAVSEAMPGMPGMKINRRDLGRNPEDVFSLHP